MTVPSFDALMAAAEWRPIPHCPGRFVLRGAPATLGVRDLVGADACVEEHRSASTPDLVLVVRLEGGGLISFRKADGRTVHTLNTEQGLGRRLARLGIPEGASG